MSPLFFPRRPLLFVFGIAVFGLLMGAGAPSALAADVIELRIIMTERGVEFDPAILEVPAGKKMKLLVINDSGVAEEFESHDFNREKIIRAGGRATIFLPPLEPGEYTFFGEFHPDTAQGKVIAK